jgi:uncharacterized protein (DUF305 family)
MTLTPVVKRTLVLLVGASLVVVAAVAIGLPELREAPDAHSGMASMAPAPGHGDHGLAGHAVADEEAFIARMIPHHQEAVDVATELLRVAESPAVRAEAEAIVVAQRLEIEQLLEWLAAWYPDAGPVAYAPMMRSVEGLDPGDAEATFMEDMIVHHEMAIAKAESYLALAAPRRAEVESLARDVLRTQAAEIERMRAWLDEHHAGDHGGH